MGADLFDLDTKEGLQKSGHAGQVPNQGRIPIQEGFLEEDEQEPSPEP